MAQRKETGRPRGKRLRRLLVVVGALLLEGLSVRLRGYRFAGNVVVRCREGHLFTTIWIPGASVKALRLGCWRYQRCPVGSHWSLVTPVAESNLSARQRRSAHRIRDIRVP